MGVKRRFKTSKYFALLSRFSAVELWQCFIVGDGHLGGLHLFWRDLLKMDRWLARFFTKFTIFVTL